MFWRHVKPWSILNIFYSQKDINKKDELVVYDERQARNIVRRVGAKMVKESPMIRTITRVNILCSPAMQT